MSNGNCLVHQRLGDQKWQGETFRSALQLLKDGGVPLDGLEAGLDTLDSWIATAA